MPACPECRLEFGDDVRTCPEHGLDLVPAELLLAGDPPLEPGTMVGEYRIDRKLGAGTFGDVYAGEQPLIGKRVAVKLLNRRFASDPVIVSRFVAEARAVNKIRQKNIIDIFSFGVVPGLDRHYFVMELLDGTTLGELLDRSGRLSVAAVLPIVQGIGDGLDAAHEAGITHRDLKPDNVFLVRERDGTYFPKLLDFGIAKLVGQDVAHKTSSGMVLGTPRYMSPEQARGRPTDHRSDIYALGVMIHEMLTGAFLFEADSAVDMLLKHAVEDPPRMSSLRPDLPRELDAPVLAMLAKRPADRPASAGDAVRAFVARAKELGLEGGSVSFADLTKTAATGQHGPQFSRTTAIASEPVGPRADDARSDAEAPPPRSAARAGQEKTMPSSPPTAREVVATGRSGPTTESVSTLETSTAIRVRTRRRQAILSAAALLVVGACALALRFGRKETPVAAGSSAPPNGDRAEALPKPDPAPPATVAVMVWTRPADAEVWLGASKLGMSSSPIHLPRGSQPVELHLRKEGFLDASVTVTPDRDQAVDATLSAPPPARSATASAAPAEPPRRATQPAKAAGSANKLDRILGGRD